MLKLVVTLSLMMFLSGCGVDTSSSNSDSTTITSTDTILPVDTVNPIDPNPIVSSSDDPSDINTTTDDTNGTSSDVSTVNPDSSDFDTVDAIEDSQACNPGTYRIASDASYGGSLTGENGASSFIVDGQGLVIRSEYLSQEYKTTWVTLYYRSFPSSSDLDLQGSTSYKMDNVFYLAYDLAWVDRSISGIDNVLYIQSDKGLKPACYRLTLDSIDGSQIDVQKVYRLRL